MGLIYASASTSSWKKHIAALNCYKDFLEKTKEISVWPISSELMSKFIVFAAKKRNLKHDTIKSYISSLRLYQKLRGLDCDKIDNFIPSVLLKGVKNLQFYQDLAKPARKAMTMPELKILSHRIAVSNWQNSYKQVLWTSFCIAFYGSFRFGEILSPSVNSYNIHETLLWKDVTVGKDFVILRVKIPKSKNMNGEFVELFQIKNSSYCPVKAIKRLKEISKFSSDPLSPVFRFDNGTFLCSYNLNKLLIELLTPVLGVSARLFSGHSFRAGIPSALSNCPDLASDEEVMCWGRWNSKSYKLYERLSSNKKRFIFSKLLSALEKQ
jgi:Phage integrase SAM-like domain